MSPDRSNLSADSWVVTAGRPHGPGEPLNTPPMFVSNLAHGGDRGYARNDSTPTWEALETVVGGLEGGSATAFASGMAAVAAVFDLVPVGGTVVLPDDLYQGSASLAARGEAAGRWNIQTVALTDTDEWHRAARHADLLWLESPSNPLVTVADIPAIAAAERRPGAMLAVDNTFATPLAQRPLEHGADVVVHAATKFIGGHSDLLGGITVTADPSLHDRLRQVRQLLGATPGTMEAWLATRGIRTLGVRLERATANAAAIANWLEADTRIATVRYPGLQSHPTHQVAARTLDGFGSIIAFDLAGQEAADAACERIELITHATSLGGVDSCMERRGRYEGQSHLPPGLIRLAVGIEDPDDLIADLNQAFG